VTETNTPTAREVIERFLEASVDPDPDKYPDLWADEFVIEMPFAPAWFPRRTESTNAELRERFKNGMTDRRYDSVEAVTIHETTNPEVVVVEYEIHGTRLSDNASFVLPYINVYTVRDGRIVSSKDHTDPIAASRAVGMLPALIEQLSAEVAGG
jgi:ketosteroid isomerase-like protein